MAIPSPYDIAMRRLRENAKQTGIYQGLVKPFVDLSDAMEDPSAYVVQDPESPQYGRLNSAGMGMAGGLANAGMVGAGVQTGPGLGMGARVPGVADDAMTASVRAGRGAETFGYQAPEAVSRMTSAPGEMLRNPSGRIVEVDRLGKVHNQTPYLPATTPRPPAAAPDFDSLRLGWEWGPEAAAGRTLDDANLNYAFRDIEMGERGSMVASPYETAKAVASEAAGAVARSPLTKPALTGGLMMAGGGVGAAFGDRMQQGASRSAVRRAGAQSAPAGQPPAPGQDVQSPWPEYGPPMSAMGQMPGKGKPARGPGGVANLGGSASGSARSASPAGGMAGAQGAPADGGPDARRVGPDHYEVIQRSADMGDEYSRLFDVVRREARKQAFASAQGGGHNFAVLRDPAYNRVHLLTASGDEFQFDMNKPSDQQEFARMASRTGMSPQQLMAAADHAAAPLNELWSPMRTPESVKTAGRFNVQQFLSSPPQDPNVAKAMLDRMF